MSEAGEIAGHFQVFS